MRWILYQLQQVEVQYQVQHRVLSRPGKIDRSNTTINFRGCWTKAANAAQLAEPHDEPHSKPCVNTPVQQLAEPRTRRQLDTLSEAALRHNFAQAPGKAQGQRQGDQPHGGGRVRDNLTSCGADANGVQWVEGTQRRSVRRTSSGVVTPRSRPLYARQASWQSMIQGKPPKCACECGR